MAQSQDLKTTDTYKNEASNSPLDSLIHEELKQAFEEGRKKGESIGYERSQKELKTVVNLFRKMVGNLLDKMAIFKTELKPELTEFCLKICEKILLRNLKSPEMLTKVISSILTQHLENLSKTISVFLAPGDLHRLHDWIKKNDVHLALNIKWNSEPTLKEGSFRIDLSGTPIVYDVSMEIENLLGYLELEGL